MAGRPKKNSVFKETFKKHKEPLKPMAMISVVASTQAKRMDRICYKLNRLKGVQLYGITFKVVKQDDFHVVTARAEELMSIDDLRKHVISLMIENFIDV